MISQTELGHALGLSKQTISKLKGQGMPVDSVEAAQAWREARQNVAARKPAPNDLSPPTSQEADGLPEDFQAARTRREIAEATMAEMRKAELEGKLIRVDAIRAAWASRISSLRDAFMQLPNRLAPVLAAEASIERVSDMLDEAIRQALEEIVRDATSGMREARP